MLVIIPPTYCVCHEPGDEEQVDAEGDAPDHQEVGGEDEHKAYQQLHPVLLGRVLATSRSEQAVFRVYDTDFDSLLVAIKKLLQKLVKFSY